MSYGGAPPAITPVYSGLQNGDTPVSDHTADMLDDGDQHQRPITADVSEHLLGGLRPELHDYLCPWGHNRDLATTTATTTARPRVLARRVRRRHLHVRLGHISTARPAA